MILNGSKTSKSKREVWFLLSLHKKCDPGTFSIGMAGSLPDAAFIIDGKLDDWEVDTTTWIPADGIQFTIEDQIGVGAFYLTPGWGGQAYDADALYAKKTGDKLYIVLATGHNPRTLNQGNSYGAGDFAIDFKRDGSFDLGINILHTESLKKGVYTFETFGIEGGLQESGVGLRTMGHCRESRQQGPC